jgi:hypothetical protein
MIQRLSVVSVLSLVVLASVGAVAVGTHAFGAASPSANGSQPGLLPAASAPGGTGNTGSGGNTMHTTTEQTTVTVTTTNSTGTATSTATSAQSSTSSAGGSLLVTNSTATPTQAHSGDDGESGGLAGGDDGAGD